MAKSKTSKRYTPEFRRQMVELVRAGRKPAELSKEFGPTPWSICDGGLTSSEREELRQLRRDNKRLKLEREILAKAAAWFAQETAPNSKRSSDS